jgi:hypothetical protein
MGLLAVSGAETVVLEDIDSGTTSPNGDYRWLDVADQLYAETYRDTYDYTYATVSVTFTASGEALQGTLEAENLKPNFAYQLKIAGDSLLPGNERIGIAGRWWQEQWTGSDWGNGQNLNNKGSGSTPNPNDLTYFSRRDIIDLESTTGLHYKYTGYLCFDYFTTDENGDATLAFETKSSYHVVWKTSQRPWTSNDGPKKTVTFDVDPLTSPAYDEDYPEQTVTIFGEWERLPVGGIHLQPGDYACQIILTEESFHGSGGTYSGSWAAAMGADIEFTITGGPSGSVTDMTATLGHEAIQLSWKNPVLASGEEVEIVRRGWGSPAYPGYSGVETYSTCRFDGSVVTTSTASDQTVTYTDDVTDRNIYFYRGIVVDADDLVNLGDEPVSLPEDPEDLTDACDRATNYFLGDVSTDYDGDVDIDDLAIFSNCYGAEDPSTPCDECDLGPTWEPHFDRLGVPYPDDLIEFEDLMVFAMNYHNVSLFDPGFAAPELLAGVPEPVLTLEMPNPMGSVGDFLEVRLLGQNLAGVVRGIHAILDFDPSVIELVEAVRGPALPSAPPSEGCGVFFHAMEGPEGFDLSAAVLGRGTVEEDGEVARVTFQVIREAPVRVRMVAELRGEHNERLSARESEFGASPSHSLEPIHRTWHALSPNPFQRSVEISFALAEEGPVRLEVFDATGRLVRTLRNEVMDPGNHRVVWDGRSDGGERTGAGIYFYQLTSKETDFSGKLIRLK